MNKKEKIVLSIDPGNFKCGIAVVEENRKVHLKKIIETEKLKDEIKNILEKYNINLVILGDKTGSKKVKNFLKEFKNIKIVLEDESFTSFKAKKKYFQENPPKGIKKFLPISFQTPPSPYDDYAAIILAEEYFKKQLSP